MKMANSCNDKKASLFFYFFNVKVKTSPPSSAFLTLIVPPCSSIAFFTMASPSPVPPILRLRPLSTR